MNDDRQYGRMLGAQAHQAPASREALRAIVDRHRRSRARNLSLVVAVAVVAGAFGGWYASQPDGTTEVASTDSLANFDGAQIAALYATAPGEGEGANPHGSPDTGGPGPGGGQRPPAVLFDRLFLRTANGIAIRAYSHRPPERPACPEGQTCPTIPAECIPSEVYTAELSNEAAIGPHRPTPVFGEPAGSEVKVLYYGIFGGQNAPPLSGWPWSRGPRWRP